MTKLVAVICVIFVVEVICGNVDPVIRSVKLTSFGDDVSKITSLYNSTWFVVGKCCPIGQIYVITGNERSNSTDKQCRNPLPDEEIDFSPIFNPFNDSGMLVPGEEHPQFITVVGIPCQYGMYELEPDIDSNDEYHLLANGSIFTPYPNPKMMAPGLDYCMDFIPGQNLTVLLCAEKEPPIATADARLALYSVGLLTSVPCLLATIFAYSITYQLRDIFGLALCCYSGCMAVAFMSLVVIQLGGYLLGENGCGNAAFVIQFSFIASFFWLNIMTCEIWQLVKLYEIVGSGIKKGRPNSNRTFFYYSLWGWGLPAILIIISLARNLPPIIPWTYVKRSGDKLPSCWFGLDKPALPYFYAPAGMLVLINAVIFTLTGIKLAKIQKDLDLRRMARNQESDREDRRVYRNLRLTFIVTLVLFLIMGINWSMELVSVLIESDLLAWSVFDFVNALQGVLVFGLFVLRKPARYLIWRRIKALTSRSESNNSNYNDRSNETTLLPVNTNNILSSRTLNQ